MDHAFIHWQWFAAALAVVLLLLLYRQVLHLFGVIKTRDPYMPCLCSADVFAELRSDPRFAGLLRRMNLPGQ